MLYELPSLEESGLNLKLVLISKMIHKPLLLSMQIYHPFMTIFTEELIMHSNSNRLLPILMHTIFHIFLTQCQFGILWMGNVTSSTYGPFMNHLEVLYGLNVSLLAE